MSDGLSEQELRGFESQVREESAKAAREVHRLMVQNHDLQGQLEAAEQHVKILSELRDEQARDAARWKAIEKHLRVGPTWVVGTSQLFFYESLLLRDEDIQTPSDFADRLIQGETRK